MGEGLSVSAEINVDGILDAMKQVEIAAKKSMESMEWLPGVLERSLAVSASTVADSLRDVAALSASGLAQSALDAAAASVDGAATIGSMLSAGVASGIRQGKSAVVGAAVDVVRAAINAANATAEIHSPSRVTAEMGRYWDQGWAEGIAGNAPLVTDAASGMVDAAMRLSEASLEAMSPDLEEALREAVYAEPPAGAAYGAVWERPPAAERMDMDVVRQAADQIVEAIRSRSDTLVMNDRRVAQVMAAETARAQGARNRSIALGYGKK